MSDYTEQIGIVDWYSIEKGYGVIKDIHNQKDYFIHFTNLNRKLRKTLDEDDVVMYVPKTDEKKHRDIATEVRPFDSLEDIKNALGLWYESDLSDDNLKAIIKSYLNPLIINNKEDEFRDNEKIIGFLDVLCEQIKTTGNEKIYSILIQSLTKDWYYDQYNQFFEFADMFLLEKLTTESYSVIFENTKSPYVCFHLCNKFPTHYKDCLHKATELSKNRGTVLLDNLLRFVNNVNGTEFEKYNITNPGFWFEMVGCDIVTDTNEYIFSNISSSHLTELYNDGYVLPNNPFLKEKYPNYSLALNVLEYKNCKIETTQFDIDFIEENIAEFEDDDLIKIVEEYNLKEDFALELFLYKTRNLISEGYSSYNYNTIWKLTEKLPNHPNWLFENQDFLTKDSVEKYDELLIWLYKNNHYQTVNETFIAKHIDQFNWDVIEEVLQKGTITYSQKDIVFSALLKSAMSSSDEATKINELKKVAYYGTIILGKLFAEWFENQYTLLKTDAQYLFWKEFPCLYKSELITKERATEELLLVVTENQEITDRTTFSKILFGIRHLKEINDSVKEIIKEKGNRAYNIALWYIGIPNEFDNELFDYDTLSRLFIYFEPQDQVVIIKSLFYMAENGDIKLTIQMLEQLTRVDADLHNWISAEHPDIPIDVSSEIVIKALSQLTKTGNFGSDKDVLNIVIKASLYDKTRNYKIGSYFDECKGRTYYKWGGKRTVCGNVWKISESSYGAIILPYVTIDGEEEWNSDFRSTVDEIKNIVGRKWNATKSIWEIPITGEAQLMDLARKYGLVIKGDNNSHMNIYRRTEEGCPKGVVYCEGRLSLMQDEHTNADFLWCRNGKCINTGTVAFHNKEKWQEYTLLDFCRILDLKTDSVDSAGREVKYGKYLSFSSIINRANSIIEHLYCRECKDMLEPVDTSNFHTHLVTKFHCTNPNCGQHHIPIYISKCFNWKCNGVIDERDTKKCPNGWNICQECGSCCSNRVALQRISHCKENGIMPNRYFVDFLNNNLGHLEKREFYCYKCGKITQEVVGNSKETHRCSECGVSYNRNVFDYDPNKTYYAK